MEQCIIKQGHCGHRLHDGDCPRNDTGIVTATRLEDRFLALFVYRRLLHEDGSHGLERYPEVDVLPIGDATLDAARMVRAGTDPSVIVEEDVVAVGAVITRCLETVAILKALHGVDGQHGMA